MLGWVKSQKYKDGLAATLPSQPISRTREFEWGQNVPEGAQEGKSFIWNSSFAHQPLASHKEPRHWFWPSLHTFLTAVTQKLLVMCFLFISGYNSVFTYSLLFKVHVFSTVIQVLIAFKVHLLIFIEVQFIYNYTFRFTENKYTYTHTHLYIQHIHKYVCMHVQSLQSSPTLCNPMDCSPPGSSVHEIFFFFLGKNTGMGCHALLHRSSPPRDETHISYVSCITLSLLESPYIRGYIFFFSFFSIVGYDKKWNTVPSYTGGPFNLH